MKKLITLSVLIGLVAIHTSAYSSYKYQRGYVKSNGSYVQGHYKTSADGTKFNNRSCYEKGNCY